MSETPGEMPEQMTTDPEQTTDEQPFDLERAMTTIRTLRQEAKGAKQHLKELEQLRQEKQQRDQAALSELERAQHKAEQLQAELDHARTERDERALEWEIEKAAARMNVVDPEAARLLLAREGLERGPDGKPRGVDEALQALLKQKPWLAGQAPAANVGNPATRAAQAGKPVFTRAQLNDSRFYSANRDAILDAMRDGRLIEG